MKKITLIALLLLAIASTTSFAQLQKGNWLLGGSASFNRNNDSEGNKYLSFGISPTALYMATDRLAAGLSLGYAHSSKLDADPKIKSTNLSVGPIVRYYIPLTDNMAVFPQATYTISKVEGQAQTVDPSTGTIVVFDYSTTTNDYSLGGGFTYFVTPSVGLEAVLNYSNSKSESAGFDDDFGSSRWGMNFGFQIYLQKRSE